MIGAEHSIVFSSNQCWRTFEQVEILQMGREAILEATDESELVDDEGFG